MACGVDVADVVVTVVELRSDVVVFVVIVVVVGWMTFVFGDAGLLTFGFFLLCESDGENDVVFVCAPSLLLPFKNALKIKFCL